MELKDKVAIICIIGIFISIVLIVWYEYDTRDKFIYIIEHHFYTINWDCDGDNITDEISSSCDDIINVQLEQGCILKSISN